MKLKLEFSSAMMLKLEFHDLSGWVEGWFRKKRNYAILNLVEVVVEVGVELGNKHITGKHVFPLLY